MKRVIFWASVAAGVTAAYLMYRRGVPLGTIAQKAMQNPIGAFAHEVQQAV